MIREWTGKNHLTVSHFNFRSNAGLPESLEEGQDETTTELKHNYVVQAVFDLDEWPNARTNNEETEGLQWNMKVFSSDAIAVVKDTDKEDREKALKESWEKNEPGRSEKAKRSREVFLIKQKQRRGEELTEEEQEFIKEPR